MNIDGTCPSCDRLADTYGLNGSPRRTTAKDLDLKELAGEDVSLPWHFKLLVVMLLAYLGWRIVDLFV